MLLSGTSSPPLYSARAIRGFSLVFSAVAGGVLLAQNLKTVGRPAAARMALWGSIGYTVLALVLVSFLPARVGGGSLGLMIGLVGSYGLNAYFAQVVPDKDTFPAKRIGKPLLICGLVFLPILLLVLYPLLQH
jgi:hypothetical protein